MAVTRTNLPGSQVVVDLRLVVAVQLEMFLGDARLFGDGAYVLGLRRLGNFDVAQHRGLFLVGLPWK